MMNHFQASLSYSTCAATAWGNGGADAEEDAGAEAGAETRTDADAAADAAAELEVELAAAAANAAEEEDAEAWAEEAAEAGVGDAEAVVAEAEATVRDGGVIPGVNGGALILGKGDDDGKGLLVMPGNPAMLAMLTAAATEWTQTQEGEGGARAGSGMPGVVDEMFDSYEDELNKYELDRGSGDDTSTASAVVTARRTARASAAVAATAEGVEAAEGGGVVSGGAGGPGPGPVTEAFEPPPPSPPAGVLPVEAAPPGERSTSAPVGQGTSNGELKSNSGGESSSGVLPERASEPSRTTSEVEASTSLIEWSSSNGDTAEMEPEPEPSSREVGWGTNGVTTTAEQDCESSPRQAGRGSSGVIMEDESEPPPQPSSRNTSREGRGPGLGRGNNGTMAEWESDPLPRPSPRITKPWDRAAKAGRCRLRVFNFLSKPPLVSALETIIS